MVFNYYSKLTRRQQSIYRHSDKVEKIVLTDPEKLNNSISGLEQALISDNRGRVESFAKDMIDTLVVDINVPDVNIRVLTVRPSEDWGELHGLYEPIDGMQKALITVWMRTATHKKAVAFRTFLRTILHEFCHHLDYEFLQLADSFHTEGFFKRESSLFKQLLGETAG